MQTKYLKNIHKYCLFFFVFIGTSLNATDIPELFITNCFKSQSWKTWIQGDYESTKEICAGFPIDFYGSTTSGNHPLGDEVCMYEVLPNGTEVFISCTPIGAFSFIPEEGKTYRIEFRAAGMLTFTVKFIGTNCLDFEIGPDNGCEVYYEDQNVKFTMTDFANGCYQVDWDFGDGNTIEYTNGSTTHQFEVQSNYECEKCQTYEVTAKLNAEFCGENCPELEITKEVRICRVTEFYTGYDNEGFVYVCREDECLDLGPEGLFAPCYYDGFSFEWSINDIYGNQQYTHSAHQWTMCPVVEGTHELTMTDPWGCQSTKTVQVIKSAEPVVTIYDHILCRPDQHMPMVSPANCSNVTYEPYLTTLPYSGPVTISCYDYEGCLSAVYIHNPIYDIAEACMNDIEDLCENQDLVVDGSCSDDHFMHRWSIYKTQGGDDILLWTKGSAMTEQAGIKNLSAASGVNFKVGYCYKVILETGAICDGSLHWESVEKEFCVNPAPPCFGGPDIYLDPCKEECVTIGLDGYMEVIPYPYPNLTHVWENGYTGVFREVCPTETTTYTITTTNEYGCVCIDEVTVYVLEHEPISNTEFPLCFSNDNESGLGKECPMEVCLDVQINTGNNCECAYSVTQLCKVIPFGEKFCFDLNQLELPFGENFCTQVIGSRYTLGNNIATMTGDNWDNHTYFQGSECECENYTHLLFFILEDGTIQLFPTYTLDELTMDETIKPNNSIATQNSDLSKDIDERVSSNVGTDLNVFPNPASSYITLQSSLADQNTKLIITDLTGSNIRTQSFDNVIDIQDIPNGVYILSIKTTTSVISKKIVINR